MISTFTSSDWRRLEQMREGFLHNVPGNYWQSERDLEIYDAVYAQRIGWKWDAVLQKLTATGWRPKSRRMLDWGCGSGVAARTVAQWTEIPEIMLYDRSGMASRFAASSFDRIGLTARAMDRCHSVDEDTLLVISHTLTELNAKESLIELARQAGEILWVEPGTHADSKRLGQARAQLLAAGHHVIAPCTHENRCPMLQAENERHWCHFFAEPPLAIFQSREWAMVGKQLSIDLRSLPYSFLATTKAEFALPVGAERIIGRPIEGNKHCRLLCCGAEGLHERMLQKRDDAALHKHLLKHDRGGAYRWQLDPANPRRILSGTPPE